MKAIGIHTICNSASLVIDDIDNTEDKVHVGIATVDNIDLIDCEWCLLDYGTDSPSFIYNGNRYYLNQFVRCNL